MRNSPRPILACVFAILCVSSVLSTKAALHYFSGTGHWYEPVYVPFGVSWDSANFGATNRGAYLCTITNAAENTFVASLVDTKYYGPPSVNHDRLGPWLGGVRHFFQNWQWVTGEPFSYSNWEVTQPDGSFDSEQRLLFYAGTGTGSTWADHPGPSVPGYPLPRGYIAEYDQYPSNAIPSGSILYYPTNGHWYASIHVAAGLTWAEANASAINLGGYLCTMTNAAENDFVASIVDLDDYSEPSIHGDFLGPWLGGVLTTSDTNWHWVTGEPFVYSNWESTQPDGATNTEQRMIFYAQDSAGSTWADHPGEPIPGYSLPRGFVAEFEKPPFFLMLSNNVHLLHWPKPELGWVLETNAVLASHNGWASVSTNQYQSNVVEIFVSLTNTAPVMFYRLRHD